MSSRTQGAFAYAYGGEDPPGVSIGDRIREKREELGIGQAELGRRLGVANTTVFRWEKKGTTPRPAEIDRLCAVLGVTKAWLEGREDEAESSAPPTWAKFMENYPEADRIDQETARAMLDFAARTGMRIRTWLDWVKLADVVLNAKPSPTFQAKKDRSKRQS